MHRCKSRDNKPTFHILLNKDDYHSIHSSKCLFIVVCLWILCICGHLPSGTGNADDNGRAMASDSHTDTSIPRDKAMTSDLQSAANKRVPRAIKQHSK